MSNLERMPNLGSFMVEFFKIWLKCWNLAKKLPNLAKICQIWQLIILQWREFIFIVHKSFEIWEMNISGQRDTIVLIRIIVNIFIIIHDGWKKKKKMSSPNMSYPCAYEIFLEFVIYVVQHIKIILKLER